MAVSAVVTLFKRDFDISFECYDVKNCKHALCSEMPPTAESKCCFDKGLQCRNIDIQIAAIDAIIRRLKNKKKDLEISEFFEDAA